MIPKFRTWSKVNVESPEMREVRGINWHGGGVWLNDIVDDETLVDWAYFDDIILMQSTGLFNKNGVEIFEGDVVTYNSSKSNYIVSFGQFICYFSAYNKRGENILRLAPGYGWYLKHFRDSFWNVSGEAMDEPVKIEVLGNIHEHPHLVEETT